MQLTSSHLACQSDDAPPAVKIVPAAITYSKAQAQE